MNSSMRNALKQAYAEKGLEVPGKKTRDVEHVRKDPVLVVSKQGAAKKNRQPSTIRKTPRPSTTENKKRHGHRGNRAAPAIDSIQEDLKQLSQAYGGSRSPSNKSDYGAQTLSPWSLKLGTSARAHKFLEPIIEKRSLFSTGASGIDEQPLRSDASTDVHDLAIGLDFGTSSVKVVVGDRSAGRAFAVPFYDVDGIDSYLLPSRLWETEGHYSLRSGVKCYRNLKLSLVASGDTSESYRRATAFLALILRHVRAWLFSQHAEIYNGTQIVWKLVLGMPAENYADKRLIGRFHALAKSAWILAGKRHEDISADMVDQVNSRVNRLETGDLAKNISEEVDVEVVPELSAQIYGFLKSSRFDKKAKNIFVMVDVGAGTVDSALFSVKHERGKWHFEFFTNHVQPHGVMNLHRMRVEWWRNALQGQAESMTSLLKTLQENEMPTDQAGAIPAYLEDYISDVALHFRDKKMHPDEKFFSNVASQVRGKTIWRAWKDGYLPPNQLVNVPLFLCGGGTRMAYYRRLEDDLKQFPGFTWLCARPTVLEIPKDLDAPGLIKQEYDRLSVAYGLSFLDVGKIVKALPQPVVPSPQKPTWHFTDRFVDKNQV